MNQSQDQLDLDSANAVLNAWDAPRIIAWAAGMFGRGLVMSSSFGAESAALVHLVTRIVPRIAVIVVDTGFLFPETLAFMRSLQSRFELDVRVYRPRENPAEYLARAGETDPQFRRDVESCCAANKNEPFERAMRELEPAAWIRGIRRDQSSTRAGRQIIERSARFGCYAISPILNWPAERVREYLQRHDLPYHPLFDQGYRSIGCSPLSCTRALSAGEDPRAGRWSGIIKTECGLHLEK